MEYESENVLTGGKGGRGQSQGRGRGRGRGRGFQNGQGQGRGKGGKKNGKGAGSVCEEASRCMQKFTIMTGKQGNVNAIQVPNGHANDIMEANMRITQENKDWLRLAISGLNIKILERARNTAGYCVPTAATRAVEEILHIHKSLQLRIKDIEVEIRDMSMQMHVDMTSFRDGKNNVVDLVDTDKVTKLLLEDNLRFGGTSLRTFLYLENEYFIKTIEETHGVKVKEPRNPIQLSYSKAENTFAVTYDTSNDMFELMFSIGVDGRPISPKVEKRIGNNFEYVLLPDWAAEQLAIIGSRIGQRSTRTHMSRVPSLSTRMSPF